MFYTSPGTDHYKFGGDGSRGLNQSLNYFPVKYTLNISLESKSHNLVFSLDQLHVGCLHRLLLHVVASKFSKRCYFLNTSI